MFCKNLTQLKYILISLIVIYWDNRKTNCIDEVSLVIRPQSVHIYYIYIDILLNLDLGCGKADGAIILMALFCILKPPASDDTSLVPRHQKGCKVARSVGPGWCNGEGILHSLSHLPHLYGGNIKYLYSSGRWKCTREQIAAEHWCTLQKLPLCVYPSRQTTFHEAWEWPPLSAVLEAAQRPSGHVTSPKPWNRFLALLKYWFVDVIFSV